MDVDAKSRAAIAGWDAAAGAESEAAAAEARGLQTGLKRGRADAEKKVDLYLWYDGHFPQPTPAASPAAFRCDGGWRLE